MVNKNLFIQVTLFIHSNITGRRWDFDWKKDSKTEADSTLLK